MTATHNAISTAIAEVEKLRKSIAKGARQVSSGAERDLVKANITTWFRTRRAVLLAVLKEEDLKGIDGCYQELMGLAGKASSRNKYMETLKVLKKALGDLEREKVIELAKTPVEKSSDVAPVFNGITIDGEMQRILANRWNECAGCIQNAFPLAGIVMIGGLLEALLIARVNQLDNKAPVFKAAAAPKDKAGHTLHLGEWTLKHYIDVACELKWISETHKDVSVILRDYRNYIHPHKEHQHKRKIEPRDAELLWNVGKTMMRELLKVT